MNKIFFILIVGIAVLVNVNCFADGEMTMMQRVNGGYASVVKSGNNTWTITDKRYQQDTPIEIQAVVSKVTLAEVNAQITAINAEIARQADLKADLLAWKTYLQSVQ
jgi:hypothetical protein